MPFSIAMSFIIALVCFAYTMISIYRYVTSSFALLERIQTSAPETWEALGRPEKVYVKGGSGGGMHTIKPLCRGCSGYGSQILLAWITGLVESCRRPVSY
jgi:hypothetical protein